MLRLLLQMGLLSGAIGLAASALDRQDLDSLIASIKATSAAIRQSGLPASGDAANAMDNGADGLREVITRQEATEAQAGNVAESKLSTAKKAFYNLPPRDCPWEKVIDPEDGYVRCSMPERNRAPNR